MTTTQTPAPAQPVTRPRSPIAYVRLCPPCAGYQPFTPVDYWGALSGRCQGCGSSHRELHRFAAVIHSASGCSCTTAHERVSGDLDVASPYDEAATDRDERAQYARHEGRGDEAERHTKRAGHYRQARDELLEACSEA